jgi:hypothetical protein
MRNTGTPGRDFIHSAAVTWIALPGLVAWRPSMPTDTSMVTRRTMRP